VNRVEQIQQAMGETDADALVLRLAENVVLATGYWPQIGGLGLVVVPREGEACLLTPEYEAPEVSTRWTGDHRCFPAIRLDGEPAGAAIERLLRELAREHGLEGKAIGFEGSFESVAPPRLDGEPNTVSAGTQGLIRSAFSTDRIIDLTPQLEAIRLVKSEIELDRLRVTNEIAKLGLDAFKEHAVAGRTEAQVAAAVESAIVSVGHGYEGTRTVRTYATVWSGPETAAGWQYFLHRDRTIEPDDVVMLELGTCADGYWSDHTRTVVAGKASDRQREALAAVLAGADAAFAAARPGATGHEVDAASRAAVSDRGFEQFPHHTGHGTGFRYHESRPQLVPGSDHVLEAGMVIVTEPGIYEEGLGGFRWEDNAAVTADGARRLAETDYGLD
jgi:Xaa-Pro aminopeptidase